MFTLNFATKAEADKILAQDDAFMKTLSPFDMQIRMRTDAVVTKDDFKTWLKT